MLMKVLPQHHRTRRTGRRLHVQAAEVAVTESASILCGRSTNWYGAQCRLPFSALLLFPSRYTSTAELELVVPPVAGADLEREGLEDSSRGAGRPSRMAPE